jgi:superfamily II DNA helicase RecQ
MSTILPPFDWSKRLKYNWYSVEGIEKLRHLMGPSLPYNPDRFQLGCTTRMMDGQDVLCLSATGDGKSALIYLASIARKGTITLVICPTNFLESDLVCSIKKHYVKCLIS